MSLFKDYIGVYKSAFGGGSGGSNPSAFPTSSSTKLSNQYMEEMLAKSLGLMQGRGTPQDLPWFKGMENELNKRTDTRTDQVLRNATARGIRGGTLEQVLKVPQEQNMQEILRAILGVYQQNPEQTMPWIRTAFGRQGQVEQSMNQQDQLNQQAKQGGLQRIMQLLGMAMGGAQGGLSMMQKGNQFEQLMKMFGGASDGSGFGGLNSFGGLGTSIGGEATEEGSGNQSSNELMDYIKMAMQAAGLAAMFV